MASILTTGPDDVWIAGLSAPQLAAQASVRYEHWDGHRWTHIDGPRLPAGQAEVSAMAARQPNDIWTVGSFTPNPTSLTGTPGSQPLIEHWDGHHWTLANGPHFKIPPPVGTPDPLIASAALNGVAVDPGGRPWAVGQQPTGGGTNEQPLVEASCHPA